MIGWEVSILQFPLSWGRLFKIIERFVNPVTKRKETYFVELLKENHSHIILKGVVVVHHVKSVTLIALACCYKSLCRVNALFSPHHTFYVSQVGIVFRCCRLTNSDSRKWNLPNVHNSFGKAQNNRRVFPFTEQGVNKVWTSNRGEQ